MFAVYYHWASVPEPVFDGPYQLDPDFDWTEFEMKFSSETEALELCLKTVKRYLKLNSERKRIVIDGIGIYDDNGTALRYWPIDC